jgi:hypothetical protein
MLFRVAMILSEANKVIPGNMPDVINIFRTADNRIASVEQLIHQIHKYTQRGYLQLAS